MLLRVNIEDLAASGVAVTGKRNSETVYAVTSLSATDELYRG